MKPAKKSDNEISERAVPCDFCPSKDGYLYTLDMRDCLRVIAICGKCRVKKKAEALYSFVAWIWQR